MKRRVEKFWRTNSDNNKKCKSSVSFMKLGTLIYYDKWQKLEAKTGFKNQTV